MLHAATLAQSEVIPIATAGEASSDLSVTLNVTGSLSLFHKENILSC
jgi:hypothetical protein